MIFTPTRFAPQLALLALTVLPLAACSDDGDKKSNDETAAQGAAADGKIGNSDPEAVIDTLNSAEWKAACVDIAKATDARGLKHGPCIVSALLGTLIGQSCQSTYDECTRSESDIDCDTKPTQCPVTLREADACITSSGVWLAEQTKGLTCSNTFQDLLRLQQDHMTDECKTVQERCAELVPESNEEEVDFSDLQEDE